MLTRSLLYAPSPFLLEIYVQCLRKRSKFAIFLRYYCNSFALMIRVTVLPSLWLRMVTCIVSRIMKPIMQNCQVSCLVTTKIKHLTSFALEIYIWKITWSNEEPSKFCEARTKTVREVEAFPFKKVKKSFSCSKMNRLFGRGKPKEPPPNLTDAISNVSRGTSWNTTDQSKWLQIPLHLSVNFFLLLRWTVEGSL